MAALVNRSRAPLVHPHAVAAAVSDRVLAARRRHPRWGPRKLRRSCGGRRLPASRPSRAPSETCCTATAWCDRDDGAVQCAVWRAPGRRTPNTRRIFAWSGWIASIRARPRTCRGNSCFRLAGSAGTSGLGRRPDITCTGQAGGVPHISAFVRDPPAGRRVGHPHRPGTARSRRCQHDHDPHARTESRRAGCEKPHGPVVACLRATPSQ